MANVGVEALLTWLNNLELTDQPLHIEDLKDGTYLLKVINTLKNERGLSLDLSVEERFNQIARFLEGDCRLRAGTGATLSRHIANGNNLTVEISKVLLLLVYYDMMNNRSTLNKMELKVEGEIASLTERFVLVTDDYVYLSNGLEAYLGRKYSSSPSTQSSSSLISDDSPVFHRSQKVKFVDLHTVATPAASSRSPLQEVMNTPRFKLRKMQTQMIHEREYKDGLTRELSSLMTQIAQKETEISQLKYQLDKIKENQNVQDQVVSDQINELETKNESLQRRLHELAKQSHDLKSDTIHMERKVDQLTEENGNLSVQVREMRLKLATCEAELERLLENQATVEKELQSQNCHLQAELSQATAKKDFQYEQIEILQGKISSLEEELSRIRLEEKGENMGPVMQRAELENEITDLKDQLEITTGSLREAKQVVQAKEVMLAQYQEDITLHKELLKQQMAKNEKEMQDKQVLLDQTQKEIADQRHILQQEKNNLQLQVDSIGALLKESEEDAKLKEEQMLQKNTRHDTALEQQKTFYQDEMGRLKEEIQQKQELIELLKVRAEKVELLNQEIQTLRNEVETLTSSLKKAEEYLQTQEDLLAKQQLDSLKIQETLQNKITMFQEEVHGLWVEEVALQADVKLAKETIQAKEDMLANLQMESSQQTDILNGKMHVLEGQLKTITTTLSNAKQDLKTQQDVCNLHQQEHAHQLEELQKQMFASEEEIERLVQEIIQKEQQMTEVKKETSAHSEELQQEINSLMSQVTGVTDSLRKAEEKLQDRETLLTQQEQESAHQKDLLQKQVSACEEELEKMKQEIKTKEEQLTLLGRNGSEQSALLQQQIQGLNSQVESLSSSLKQTEEEVLGQKHQLSKQELESTQQMEALQRLNLVSEENIRLLKEEIQTKETLLNEIRTESSKQSENLANQIQHLTLEMDNTKESLKMASEEVEAKEDVLTNLRQERDQLKTAMEVCEDEKALLKEEILLKEQQVTEVKKETSTNSEELQQEINSLMSQVTCVTNSLRKTQEKLQDRETLLTQQEQKSAHQKDLLQKQVSASEVEVEMLKQEIKLKEEQLTLLGQNGSEQTAFLQQTIEVLTNQVDSHSFSMKEAEKDIQTASDAAKHYKTQMENAMNHYKAKKQLLQESQEQVAEMQCSLDVKEKIGTEFKLLQLDFETVKSNEKNLLSRITSLEAQLAFADGQLREHNKMRRDGGRLQDSYFTETEENWKIQTRELKEKHDSFDSQGDDTLEDSLSTTRRPSAPGESSTPMVRSSERLAGKRRSLSADSLESLYFTPMNNKQTNRTKRHMDSSLTSLAELPDSTLKYLSSSVKRRRTTQVINITMSKKTPRRGGSDNDHHGEDEDTFYSLASARSHPNLSNSHAARPVSMELSGRTAASSDQLMSLPGYRRSTSSNTAPTRSTSTFCVGAENEPENGPDDWMRIAELQSRNKACLPHLKSSYPLESRPSIGPEFVITDDDLRMGDPTDTIRRATLMPGQMLDSLSSHRLSYMVGQTDTAGTRAHRHSLLPGQLPARTHSSSLQKYPLSPEAKASCFPRPLTPKYKNSHMTSSSTQIRTALSPVQRRESTVFTIENTPKKNSYLQKGLNRLRSSTRKSPGKGPKTSPAQRASGRSPGNRAAEVGVAVARRGNTRALPQGAAAAAAAKGQRRSPRTSAKNTAKSPRTSAKSTAKSPRTSAKSTTNSQLLTSSARKMMSRMKV